MCFDETNLFQRHAVLDKERNTRVQVPNIFFKDEILLGLRGDVGFEFTKNFLCYVTKTY